MRNLPLSWKLSLPLVLFSLVLAIVVGLFLWTLGRVQINGPIYDRIVEGKDLIADVLPPPMFIIEADHLAWKLTNADRPSDQQALVQAIEAQRTGPGGLEERQAFWLARLAPGAVRSVLADKVVPTARAYFQVLEDQVVPALRTGGAAAAKVVVAGPLAAAFEAHKAAVGEVVAAANRENQARETDSRGEIATLLLVTLGLSALGALVAVGFSLALSRQLTRSMRRLVEVSELVVAADREKIGAAQALSRGDLTVEIPLARLADRLGASGGDEVGQLFRAFGEIAESQDRLAEALMAVTDGLRTLVGEIRAGSEDVAEGARQVSDASQHLSEGAGTQAAAVEEVSASMTTMGEQVRANAARADQARDLSAEADRTSQVGKDQVLSLVAAMDGLEASSVEVTRVVKVIDDIAFKVNLLSLNAAVEAARAGAHGRGFAVVAQEVRSLASSSAKAAHETEVLIGQSLAKIQEGAQLTRQTSEVFSRIGAGVGQVGRLVKEIAAASQTQDQGVQQIIQSLVQIEGVTQANTSTAEQTAAASVDLTGKSAELRRLTQRFRLKENHPSD